MSPRYPTALLLLVTLLAVASTPGRAQSRDVSSPRGDAVRITKITPRVDAEVPLPVRFAYTLEVTADLKSSPRGTLQVRFLRGRPGLGPSATVAPPLQRAVQRGQSVKVELRSAPVTLTDRSLDGSSLWVIATLKDAAGKELASSTSVNRVSGVVKIRPNPAPATSDNIEVLYCNPARDTSVPAGTTTQFVLRIYYSVKSSKDAFLNVEFGDVFELSRGLCWFSTVIPLPQGTGIAELRVQRYFPNFLAGNTFGIALPLRLTPLGGSKTFQEIKPFNLIRPGSP